jgi:uncharacterized protein DUF5941/CDP-alcohol phosphatidyltransferase-like enzyme
VTHALLFATEAAVAGSAADGSGPPSASALLPLADGTPIVADLAAKLTSLDVDRITVVSRPEWADDLRRTGLQVVESKDIAGDLAVIRDTATSNTGSVALLSADLLGHRAAFNHIAGARARRVVAAIQAGPGVRADDVAPPVMRERDLVISIGTQFHQVTNANAAFRSMLSVPDGDRHRLAEACAALLAEADNGAFDLDEAAGRYGATTLALLGLVRTGVTTAAYNVRLVQAIRVTSVAAARAAEAEQNAIDEDDARAHAAIKEDEEFLALHLVHSTSPFMVRWFYRHNITPDMVTWISIAVGVAAALVVAIGGRVPMVIGSVLLYASFGFDCMDGTLARYGGRTSQWGGWLDMIADRAKEYLVFAGFAIGGIRMHEKNMWALAIAAMVLQTIRHTVDTWYGALQDTATRALPEVPLDSRLDRLGLRASSGATPGGIGGKLGQLSASAHGRYRSPAYWLKRSVVLPIGDRWLLIAISAALFGPRWMFIILLAAATLAFAYVFAGRTLRARSMKVAVMPRFGIAEQRDDGVIARLVASTGIKMQPLVAVAPSVVLNLVGLALEVTGHDLPGWFVPVATVVGLAAALGAGAPHTGPLDWLIVTGLRTAEYTFIVLAGVAGGVPLPLVYGLIATLVLYHYDLAGRTEKAATPFRGIGWALGWDVRTLVLGVAVTAGVGTGAYAVATAYLAALLVVGTGVGLVRTPKPQPAIA